MKEAIVAWLHSHRQELRRTYEELHALAETSWQEHQTTRYLRRALDEIEIEYEGFSNHTGLVAHWNGRTTSWPNVKGPSIALRTDIDALWQQVDGVGRANHSCGHDAHMTMVLFALKALRAIGFQPVGELRVLFQPAEEVGEGALKLLEAGSLDTVEYLLGIHLRPAKELAFGQASSAIYHGACAVIEGKVIGCQAHASRPSDGLNVIEVLADVIQAVRAVSVDYCTVPASCKVTKLHVPNGSSNIIPDFGTFTIDVRAQTNLAMDQLLPELEAAVHSIGKAYGSAVEYHITSRMVAAHPDPYLEALVEDVIVELLGNVGRVPPLMTPGGEDFHFYPLHKPELHATMIGLGCGLLPGLHHPQMQFNLDALEIGVGILALSVVRISSVELRRQRNFS